MTTLYLGTALAHSPLVGDIVLSFAIGLTCGAILALFI